MINNAIAQLQMMQITTAKASYISAAPSGQNSAQKELGLAKKFGHKLDIKTPPIAMVMAIGRLLTNHNLRT